MDKKNEYFEWVIITSKKYFLVEQSLDSSSKFFIKLSMEG